MDEVHVLHQLSNVRVIHWAEQTDGTPEVV